MQIVNDLLFSIEAKEQFWECHFYFRKKFFAIRLSLNSRTFKLGISQTESLYSNKQNLLCLA
jgi:hypothetical protein